jgi:phosphopantothenoylcysteine decarboxylase/phosphopantothenate--cysteine ligase
MSSLAHKQICVIVTGGIAAYKTPDIVRQLRAAGARVQVVMTPAAQEFIRPLAFQAISGEPVHTDLLDSTAEAAMGHIELARWAHLILVAPASADFLARLAHGLANDLASTLCLATAAPILVAPAMNRLMWSNPATVANAALLAARGVVFCGPMSGAQACGEIGPGRMAEPSDIVAAAAAHFASTGALTGLTVLITAGPTREPLDPVRFLTNRSSGKMGFALAAAARAAGAQVLLVAGPTAVAPPPGCEVVCVERAQEMFEAVMARVPACDIFIGSAAVADYTTAPATQKIKKSPGALTLTLVATKDILAHVAACPDAPFTVGFAAETERLEYHARAKLESKSLDLIAANLVGVPGIGFDSDENQLSVFWRGGEIQLAKASKHTLAQALIALIAERYRAKRS